MRRSAALFRAASEAFLVRADRSSAVMVSPDYVRRLAKQCTFGAVAIALRDGRALNFDPTLHSRKRIRDKHAESIFLAALFKGGLEMPITSTKDFLVSRLNEVRQGMERGKRIYEELGRATRHPRIKEALDARALIAAQSLYRLDECFRLIGEKPAEVNPREYELFFRDLREQLDQIESPDVSRLFVLEKASRLGQTHEAVSSGLIEAADALGYSAVGLLIESCLADRRVFTQWTKRQLRESHQKKTLRTGAA